jgi:hypothetical protein
VAAVLDKLPSHAPDPIVRNCLDSNDDTPHYHQLDPFVLVDEAGERAAETDNSKASADRARSQTADDIDWLPQYLKTVSTTIDL